MIGQASRNAPLRLIAGRDAPPSTRAASVGVPTTPSAQLSQLPAQVNLAIYAGDDFSFTLTATNPDATPVDFTGATIKAQIRSKPSSPDPPAGTFTTSVAANVVTLKLTSAVSKTLVGVFYWDCEVTYVTGLVHTLAGGMMNVTGDVSR
jgi:hypothetical protein